MIKSNEVSPKVPEESQTLTIPTFFKQSPFSSNNNQQMNGLSNSFIPQSTDSIKTQESTDDPSPKCCACPHVLIADDDPFQKFYYQTLFMKSIDFDGLSVEKKDFRFLILSSGEELIEQYELLKECDCKNPLLIIVDYNMGQKVLDGVETLQKLRKAGYKGKTILRTSDSKIDVHQEHPELDELLHTKIIDYLLNKENHAQAKEAIRILLKKPTQNT